MATAHSETAKKYHSLSELAGSISSQLQKTYSKSYWITAEISKLNYYPQSGHCYPQLVEKKDGKIVADLKGFILKRTFQDIRKSFLEITGKELNDGMQILFRCKLSFHAVYGLSLNILDIEPSFTLGEMARMRQAAISRLKAEGIFNQNKLLYLPMLIQKIAIISVETSKGYQDFRNILGSSPLGKNISLSLFPALLQGDAAIGKIISALTSIQNSGIEFDAVAIIRGGGGETGLDCYDSYELARIVSLFPIPVLTGIGHASNLTVVEQVAYKNLITPTDLARNIIQGFTDFALRINKAKRSLMIFRKGWFKMTLNALESNSEKLIRTVNDHLDEEKQLIRNQANRISNGVENALSEAKVSINYKRPIQLKTAVKNDFDKRNRLLTMLKPEIGLQAKRRVEASAKKLEHISDKLRILDPVNTLKRGFSITTHNGKPVTDASKIKKGDQLETRLWKGTIKTTKD